MVTGGSFAAGIAESFIGSLAAVACWFHYDIEDHWRLWKARRGKLMEERAKRRDEKHDYAHEEVLREDHDRGFVL